VEAFGQQDRENLRQRTLEILYEGRAYQQSRIDVMRTLEQMGVRFNRAELDQVIAYLQLKEMVTVLGVTEPTYRLTALGVDACEGNVPMPIGISPLD
jgi:hypothetical protein